MQDQLSSQFSVIYELASNFNSTIQDINFNNDQIKTKLLEVDNFLRSSSNEATLKSIMEILNHQQLMFNLILTIFQDIENSITFCKLGTLHPSIIGTHQLFEELQKLSDYSNPKLTLEIKYENILEIESTIKVTCAIHEDEIVYFLNIPLSDNQEYSLYYLRPIPTSRNNEYVSIFPGISYLLKHKSNNSVIPLSDNCQVGNVLRCTRKLISNQNAECEIEILASGSTEHCKYVRINFQENWIEQIPESNQHLAIFPYGDKIEVNNKHSTEILELKGIFLISEQNSEVFYKGQPLHSESKSLGYPKLLSNLQFEIRDSQMTNESLTLKELNLKNVKLNRIEHLEPLDFKHYYVPSVWTLALYLLIFGFILYTIIMYCKHERKLTTTRN